MKEHKKESQEQMEIPRTKEEEFYTALGWCVVHGLFLSGVIFVVCCLSFAVHKIITQDYSPRIHIQHVDMYDGTEINRIIK